RGGPENPLSDGELKAKFLTNATRALPEEQARELGEALDSLESTTDQGDVIALMRDKDQEVNRHRD
nr:hypothetical protein [Rubrobacter sp.]